MRANDNIRSQDTTITRGSKNFFINQTNSEYGRRTFANAGAKAWNSIPLKVRSLGFKPFKLAISSILSVS